MKGPSLQYDVRVLRVFRCDACGREIRTPGSVTSYLCSCSDPPRWMHPLERPRTVSPDVTAFLSPPDPDELVEAEPVEEEPYVPFIPQLPPRQERFPGRRKLTDDIEKYQPAPDFGAGIDGSEAPAPTDDISPDSEAQDSRRPVTGPATPAPQRREARRPHRPESSGRRGGPESRPEGSRGERNRDRGSERRHPPRDRGPSEADNRSASGSVSPQSQTSRETSAAAGPSDSSGVSSDRPSRRDRRRRRDRSRPEHPDQPGGPPPAGEPLTGPVSDAAESDDDFGDNVEDLPPAASEGGSPSAPHRRNRRRGRRRGRSRDGGASGPPADPGSPSA